VFFGQVANVTLRLERHRYRAKRQEKPKRREYHRKQVHLSFSYLAVIPLQPPALHPALKCVSNVSRRVARPKKAVP
jgi:hypothetical protein